MDIKKGNLSHLDSFFVVETPIIESITEESIVWLSLSENYPYNLYARMKSKNLFLFKPSSFTC